MEGKEMAMGLAQAEFKNLQEFHSITPFGIFPF